MNNWILPLDIKIFSELGQPIYPIYPGYEYIYIYEFWDFLHELGILSLTNQDLLLVFSQLRCFAGAGDAMLHS